MATPDPYRVLRDQTRLAVCSLWPTEQAFDGFNRAVDTLLAGDPATALASADEALRILPGDENIRFVRSGAMAALGDLAGSGAEVRSLIADRPSWETIVRSFADKGLMAVPPDMTIDSILDPD